jgi:hypothetical protein
MGELFDKQRLDRLAKEMAKHEFVGRVSGTFKWSIDQNKDGLTFTKADDKLSVEVSNLAPLGRDEGTSLGYRDSFYKADVVVRLDKSMTWEDTTSEVEEVTLYAGHPYEQKGKTFKRVRSDVCNRAIVELGRAASRGAVLNHMDTHLGGFVHFLLRDLDKCLAGMFWESGDKPAASGKGPIPWETARRGEF